jgi:sortase (surface protein transpeptidase)
LSGHVNWKGQKGPFDELWRVKGGQEVDVVDTAGGKWVYKISDIVTVDKSKLDQSAPQLFGQDGPHRLVLVTCGGDYVGGTEGYAENRIVTADLVSHP